MPLLVNEKRSLERFVIAIVQLGKCAIVGRHSCAHAFAPYTKLNDTWPQSLASRPCNKRLNLDAGVASLCVGDKRETHSLGACLMRRHIKLTRVRHACVLPIYSCCT